MGNTQFNKSYPALFQENGNATPTSVSLEDGSVIGTYLHGFFDFDNLREAFLGHVRKLRKLPIPDERFDYKNFRKEQLDRLAKIIDEHIDLDQVREMMI